MSTEKRIFGGNPPDIALNQLNRLQQRDSTDALASVDSVHNNYLGGKSSFARMWTATNITGSNVDEIVYHSINEGREFSYQNNTTGSISDNYQIQNQSNPYLKPAAGITSLSSKSEGALGALRTTNVEFQVHNKEDFETIFLPFFLRPGAMVCVDFGWSDNFKLYDPKEMVDLNRTMESFDNKIQEFVKDNLGLVEVCVGIVRKYDVSVTDLGSFNCSVELTSRNYSLLDAEVTDENSLKFIFSNMLEDIIIKTLLSPVGLGNQILNKYIENPLSTEDYSSASRVFFDSLSEPSSLGIITKGDFERGIYYQDILDIDDSGFFDKTVGGDVNPDNEVGEEEEALYISYGFLEDNFLNKFVKSVISVDKEGDIKSLSEPESLELSFNSSNSKIRYNDNLFKAQTQPLFKGESLPSFLLPNRYYDDDVEVVTDDLMEIRDLFIKTSLIAESFKKKQNVNDALEHMWERINDECTGLWSIKMASPKKQLNSKNQSDGEPAEQLMDVGSQISFIDVNAPMTDEVKFSFDLTSGNGFVKNADIKFQTPKAGMASMLAISNTSSDKVFYKQDALTKLNLLRMLNSEDYGEGVFFKSLPAMGNPNDDLDEYTTISVNTDELKPVSDSTNASDPEDDDLQKALDAYNEEIKKLKKGESGTSSSNDPTKVLPPEPEEGDEDKKVITADSPKEYYRSLAKIDNMYKSSENTLSPVLPIELSLTTYGNNLFQIGDIFTINYLPKHYVDRVYFQIMGIDHKVDTNGWDVTYNTVMRPKPNKLDKILIPRKDIVVKLSLTHSRTLQSHLNHESFKNGIVNSVKVGEYNGFDILLNTFNGTADNGNELRHKKLHQSFIKANAGSESDIAFHYAVQKNMLSKKFFDFGNNKTDTNGTFTSKTENSFSFSGMSAKFFLKLAHSDILTNTKEIFKAYNKILTPFYEGEDVIRGFNKFDEQDKIKIPNPLSQVSYGMEGSKKYKFYTFTPSKIYKQSTMPMFSIPVETQYIKLKNGDYKSFLDSIKEDYRLILNSINVNINRMA